MCSWQAFRRTLWEAANSVSRARVVAVLSRNLIGNMTGVSIGILFKKGIWRAFQYKFRFK